MTVRIPSRVVAVMFSRLATAISFFTSSSTGAGRDEILSYIEKINNDILK